jgi:hypothetical protein
LAITIIKELDFSEVEGASGRVGAQRFSGDGAAAGDDLSVGAEWVAVGAGKSFGAWAGKEVEFAVLHLIA